MPRKKKTEEVTNSVTFSGDELKILDEVFSDYKGFIEYTYKNNVAIITQGEKMLRESNDKDKTIDLVKALNKYKEQAEMLDLARLRCDQLHQKVQSLLPKEEDEGDTKEWVDEPHDGDTADEPAAEVSEES